MDAISFSMPEWERIRMGSISDANLFRHFLFLGESGSGKTTSGIKPLCRLAFSSSSPLSFGPAAGLVVDPKGELGDYLAILAKNDTDRFVQLRLKEKSAVLWQFENEQIDGKDGNSLVNTIFAFAESYQRQLTEHRDAFWIESTKRLVATLIDIDLVLYRHCNGRGAANIRNFWRHLHGLIDHFAKADRDSLYAELPRSIAAALKERRLAGDLIESLLSQTPEGAKDHTFGYQRGNYLSHIYQLVSASTFFDDRGLSDLCDLNDSISAREPAKYHSFWAFLCQFIESYRLDDKQLFDQRHIAYFRPFTCMAENTYSSILVTFNSILQEYISPEFIGKISINPFEPPENQLSIFDAIENGKVVVYTPEKPSPVATCIGKVLKRTFFKALLVPERLNNPNVRPFFYVCDEFHQFITHDAESGEQSLLDRCRAYRVSCVLATQSLASLHYAFPDQKGHHAINVLVNNTGTKMFFRTTDAETAASLRWLIPEPNLPGRPHLISVRPPSTLQTGECYYALVNGSVGRGQVKLEDGI